MLICVPFFLALHSFTFETFPVSTTPRDTHPTGRKISYHISHRRVNRIGRICQYNEHLAGNICQNSHRDVPSSLLHKSVAGNAAVEEEHRIGMRWRHDDPPSTAILYLLALPYALEALVKDIDLRPIFVHRNKAPHQRKKRRKCNATHQ